jgi:hypothetical protein
MGSGGVRPTQSKKKRKNITKLTKPAKAATIGHIREMDERDLVVFCTEVVSTYRDSNKESGKKWPNSRQQKLGIRGDTRVN